MTGGRHANKFHQKTPKFGYAPTKFDDGPAGKIYRFKIWHHVEYLCQCLGGYSKEDCVKKKLVPAEKQIIPRFFNEVLGVIAVSMVHSLDSDRFFLPISLFPTMMLQWHYMTCKGKIRVLGFF